MLAHSQVQSAPPALPSDMAEPAVPLGAEPESAIHGPIAGRYDVGDRIARGGMGVVYRAHDRLLNRTVAVKIMRGRFMDRPDLLRRFLAEARINGRLQHPGVVPVYEVGTLADTRPFIAMKLIEGQTLARLLRERQSPADNLAHYLEVFKTLCHTVAYAHRQGVIHRDLKPDNIMVGEFGEVQVMDWGLAKFLDPADAVAPTPDGFEAVEKSPYLSGDGTTPAGDYLTEAVAIRAVGPDEAGVGYTTAGEVFGTLPYMPPEQACGETDRVDRRCDVFALGAILCQLLTGQPPYFGTPETLRDQARAGKLFGAYVLLDRCGADQALVLLAKHCLAVDPDARPADAGVLASMVTQCLEGLQDRTRQLEMSRMQAEARLAEAEARETLARKARQLARALAVASVLVAGLLVAWIGYFTRNHAPVVVTEYHEPEPSRPAAVSPPAEPAPLAAALAQWQAGLFDATDSAAAARAGHELLASFGLNVLGGDPAAAGAEVQQHPAAGAVKRALADWLAVTPDAAERRQLAAVLTAAGSPPPAAWLAALESGDPAALAAAAGTEDGIPAAGLVRTARQLAGTGPATAEQLLARAVRSNPDNFALNLELGTVLRTHGKPADAIRYLTVARAARPTDPAANRELGLALADAGRADEALEVLRTAVEADPKWAAGHLRVGALLTARHDGDGARESFTAALAADPTSGPARLGLAQAELTRGDLDAAVAAFRLAAKVPALAAAAHAGLGRIHLRRWEASAAVTQFRAAVAAEPANIDYRLGLVEALRVANDTAGALREARAAATAVPRSADAHRAVGDLLARTDDPSGAVAAYRAAVLCEPKDPDAHQRLAGLYDRLNNLTGAVAEYRAVANLRPTDVNARLALAHALERAGDGTGAIGAFREALAVEPGNPTIRQALGRALAAQGDEAGLEELRAAVAARPASGDVRVELAEALMEVGRFRAAATAWREAATLFPADSVKQETARSAARRATRLAALEDRLPEFLTGLETPSSPASLAELGEVCRRTKRYAAAARFYGEAADGDSQYAGPAAVCAALAGFGRGADAQELSAEARAEWRKTALVALQRSAAWARDPALTALRDTTTMDGLAADEREAWQAVWGTR